MTVHPLGFLLGAIVFVLFLAGIMKLFLWIVGGGK